MLNLDLIHPLPQPNWALTPFLDSPPTILDYRRDKQKYQPHIIENGVYRITAIKEAMRPYGDDLFIVDHSDWWAWVKGGRQGGCPWNATRDTEMKLMSSNNYWVESLAKGTISYNSGIFEFIGVFVKNGSVISFDTLHEETKPWQI